MADANASHEITSAAGAWPVRSRLFVAAAAGLTLLVAFALWARFGEGVYGQMLLNAVIACF